MTCGRVDTFLHEVELSKMVCGRVDTFLHAVEFNFSGKSEVFHATSESNSSSIIWLK